MKLTKQEIIEIKFLANTAFKIYAILFTTIAVMYLINKFV